MNSKIFLLIYSLLHLSLGNEIVDEILADEIFESEELYLHKRCPSKSGECRPFAECASYIIHGADKKKYCQLEKGTIGYCCLDIEQKKETDILIQTEDDRPQSRFDISFEDFEASAAEAKENIKAFLRLDARLSQEYSFPQQHHHYHGKPKSIEEKRELFNISLEALEMGEIYKALRRRLELPEHTAVAIPEEGRSNYPDKCSPSVSCYSAAVKYRTYDGSCNNPRYPWYGMINTPQTRMLPAVYKDGVHEPRLSNKGAKLPNPMYVSGSLSGSGDNYPLDKVWTAVFSSFGQFLDHDLAKTDFYTSSDGKDIQCCEKDKSRPLPAQYRHPQCFPIEISAKDPFYGRYGIGCMNFVRSIPAVNKDCYLAPLDQLNTQTSWLDLSMVYGKTAREVNSLRGPRGTLMTSYAQSCSLLPVNPNPNECEMHSKYENPEFCFLVGDSRVNQNFALVAHHLLWLRQHNAIAEKLYQMNPTWPSCQIFQEARRITTAMYTHIVYNEYIPGLIGTSYAQRLGILPLTNGYSTCYDPKIPGTLGNEFAVAAFRLHTITPGVMPLLDNKGYSTREYRLRDIFHNPAIMNWCSAEVDELIRGQILTPMAAFDYKFTKELTRYLFRKNQKLGDDLFARNVQRGRDHGIDFYNAYRETCGLRPFKSFEDARGVWRDECIEILKEVYYGVIENVELYVGGLCEKPAYEGEGLPAIVGETFRCIIGDQFYRSKCGDRYFYDVGNQPHSFTTAQLKEIRKSSLAGLICKNSGVTKIQPLAFLLWHKKTNPFVDCSSYSIPKIDLSPWKDEIPGNFDCQE